MRHVIVEVQNFDPKKGSDARTACLLELFVPVTKAPNGFPIEAEPGHFVDVVDPPGVQPDWCNVCKRHALGGEQEQGLHGDLGLLEEDNDVLREENEEKDAIISEEVETPETEWQPPKG